MTDNDWAVAGITTLANAYATGQARPSDVLQESLHRIAAIDPGLGAVQALLPERAAASARESDKRWAAGTPRPLEGIPFGVKDIVQVDGTTTTFGSQQFREFTASITADVVGRIEAAGGVLVAKLATYEFAAGPNDDTGNPWNRERESGGSSSGPAAAVAAGLLPLAVGTDTGGSIRVPSAWCGAVGLKPTYGRVSCHGVAPLSWTLDHVGPITRTVGDAATALAIMASDDHPFAVRQNTAGHDTSLKGIRVGRPSHWFSDLCQPDVLTCIDQAIRVLEEAGATVVDVEIPLIREFNPDTIKHVLVGAEAASFHEPMRSRWSGYSAGFRQVLELGESLPATDYVRALRLRSCITRAVRDVMQHCDVIVTPTSGIEAPLRGTSDTVTIGGTPRNIGAIVARNTSIFNICGFPAITVPCGLSAARMPAGAQITAGAWNEQLCFEVGNAIERDIWLPQLRRGQGCVQAGQTGTQPPRTDRS